MNETLILDRPALVQRARRLEYFTIAWNTVEGLVAIGAGALAGSISLVGFGIDSFIEVASASVLLWRTPIGGLRFGLYLEPSYDYIFGPNHEHSLGISGGLLISIRWPKTLQSPSTSTSAGSCTILLRQ